MAGNPNKLNPGIRPAINPFNHAKWQKSWGFAGTYAASSHCPIMKMDPIESFPEVKSRRDSSRTKADNAPPSARSLRVLGIAFVAVFLVLGASKATAFLAWELSGEHHADVVIRTYLEKPAKIALNSAWWRSKSAHNPQVEQQVIVGQAGRRWRFAERRSSLDRPPVAHVRARDLRIQVRRTTPVAV